MNRPVFLEVADMSIETMGVAQPGREGVLHAKLPSAFPQHRLGNAHLSMVRASPRPPSSGPVQLRISSFEAVEVAVQLMANGVGVALLIYARRSGLDAIPAR